MVVCSTHEELNDYIISFQRSRNSKDVYILASGNITITKEKGPKLIGNSVRMMNYTMAKQKNSENKTFLFR